jgi:hypothetical protein
MATWVEQVHARAAIVHEQMAAWHGVGKLEAGQAALQAANLDVEAMTGPFRALLQRLYTEDLPLARMMDTSDLIFHAEGPSAHDALPSLHAINWLTATAEKQLRALAKALFDLAAPDARRLAQGMDLRLSGFAPGSIYAGIKLEPPEDDALGEGCQEPVFLAVREAIRHLPFIPFYVGAESLDAGIYEAFPDAAQRDAGLTAAYQLAPTGKLGIHTLEMFVPGEAPSGLSQRERVVIREALRRPALQNRKTGRFTGEVREIDLDKTRFHLRNIAGVGALRCVVHGVTADEARALIGSRVTVEGDYEADAQGRPRLMLVSSIVPSPAPEQAPLSMTH